MKLTWKEEGLSNEVLVKKFGLSLGGVKGLKARLRQCDPSLYARAKKKDANISYLRVFTEFIRVLVHFEN